MLAYFKSSNAYLAEISIPKRNDISFKLVDIDSALSETVVFSKTIEEKQINELFLNESIQLWIDIHSNISKSN